MSGYSLILALKILVNLMLKKLFWPCCRIAETNPENYKNQKPGIIVQK